MTRTLLNTLYVGTDGALARLQDDQVKVVDRDGTKLLEVPLHHLGSIHLFGGATATTGLMMRCAEDGRALVLMDYRGRFKARVSGKTGGNVLLRKAQYDAHASPESTLHLGRHIVAGKLQNARQVLLRAAREARNPEDAARLLNAAAVHADCLPLLPATRTMDEIRGVEGTAAQAYFAVFDAMILKQRTDFGFDSRSRRPPRDRTNALLSFLYSVWTSDCVSALEGVGLDPQFGYLHVLRPGRPALALDLVEEFRSVVLDRLALSLINRRQIGPDDFDERLGGSVLLTDDGRKKVLAAYQKRKLIEVGHALLPSKLPLGLLPHIQARLLARHLRGEMAAYVPYFPQ